jgi:Arc/MetJ family transcription regulator
VYKNKEMRTNINLDDDLVDYVMEHSKAKTKKEAVELALKAYKKLLAQRGMLGLMGKVKWEGDLDETRTDRFS